MLMILQAAEPPPLPWWVMYVMLLGVTYGTYRLTKLAWWGGCMSAAMGWFILFAFAMITIPGDNVALTILLPFIPVAAWVFGLRRHHKDVSPRAEIAARLPGRAWKHLPPAVMQGQPSPRAVERAKVMADRFAAGMPSDASFIARLHYVSGLGEMPARPVDLFAGGGQLWVAPLTREPPPTPIPLRDVLRVDVWPELEGPPTLRVNWSPPGAEGTRDLVLAAMPNLPANLIQPQLQAIAGVLTGLRHAPDAAAEIVVETPEPFAGPQQARTCPRCGEHVPAGARVCPRCILPMPA
ncbi:MAG TPA: zinc ribbon domain-containing protein [Longimicrobiaceae bacterium]